MYLGKSGTESCNQIWNWILQCGDIRLNGENRHFLKIDEFYGLFFVEMYLGMRGTELRNQI